LTDQISFSNATVYQMATAESKLEDVLKEGDPIILVGFDILQIPRYKIVVASR
jgi:hypothetical protein